MNLDELSVEEGQAREDFRAVESSESSDSEVGPNSNKTFRTPMLVNSILALR